MLTVADYLLAVLIYGLFRDPQPNQTLVDEVIKEMGKQGADTSQVVMAPTKHCRNLILPTAGECYSDTLA
jgi:hypothetical protein